MQGGMRWGLRLASGAGPGGGGGRGNPHFPRAACLSRASLHTAVLNDSAGIVA